MKTVEELKRPSSNERRDESVRLTDAKFRVRIYVRGVVGRFDSYKTRDFVRTSYCNP